MINYNGEELKDPFPLGKLKYLVTGTGRSGTVFMAKLLSSVGIPCGHEAIFQHDESWLERLNGKSVEMSLIAKLASIADEEQKIPWFKKDKQIIAESSYMAAPWLGHEALKDVTVIHVVRHPMKVINSFAAGLKYFNDWCLVRNNYKEYHNFIYTHIPALAQKMRPIDRAALYYVEWNEMIERLKGEKYIFHRLESNPRKLLELLGVNQESYYNNHANHKKGLEQRYLHFNDIPDQTIRDRVMAMANRYYIKL